MQTQTLGQHIHISDIRASLKITAHTIGTIAKNNSGNIGNVRSLITLLVLVGSMIKALQLGCK